jgi:hypothetical protein
MELGISCGRCGAPLGDNPVILFASKFLRCDVCDFLTPARNDPSPQPAETDAENLNSPDGP